MNAAPLTAGLRRLLGLVLFFAAGRSLGEESPTYAALRGARPAADGFFVKGLVLQRDVFRFEFESGVFQLLPNIEGRSVGAVFVGQGKYDLAPAMATERSHLALVTGEKELTSLSDRFDSLVLLFGDRTADEIRKAGTASPGRPDTVSIYEKFLKRQRKDFKTNFHLRILADLLNGADQASGVFIAFVDGKKHAPAIAAVDPLGAEQLLIASGLGGEEVAFFVAHSEEGGFWYLAHRQEEIKSGRVHPLVALADAQHYVIDTTIRKNTDIEGTTTVRFEPLASGLRVLPVNLAPTLRILDAQFRRAESEPWTPAAFVQEADDEDADSAVVFPAPLSPKEAISLRIRYQGENVLTSVGDSNFVVGARQSWYPNLGTFLDLATFDLTYRIPKAYEVVSVGTAAESKLEGNVRISTFKTEKPIRVAGFNYGKFKKLERFDKDSGIKIQVFTNPGKPDILRELQDVLSLGGIDTSQLADSALVDAFNASRVCSTYFGPLPYSHVAVTQQSQWSFGQSWPSLIFLPYLAFLDSTQRQQLGLNLTTESVEQLGFHELAHQWWGHHVGWASYRDEWLSEGFAEFTSALVLQHTKGFAKYVDFWEKSRKEILGKSLGSSVRNSEAGPISLGWRLATRRSPSATFVTTYLKGGFVLHMLRMIMREPANPDPDARFIAMMKDFVSSFAGKSPSTADFQTVVERHITPGMNLSRDGKMDWFFRQWVFGTEIPRYPHKLEVKDAGGGQYQISGSISQEGVSEDFRALVRLYFEFDKGNFAVAGGIPFLGNATVNINSPPIKLPKKPKRVVLNAFEDVLARD